MSQSYTYIDSWGLQAQYHVYDADRRNEYYSRRSRHSALLRAGARPGQDGVEDQHGDPKQDWRQQMVLTAGSESTVAGASTRARVHSCATRKGGPDAV